MTDLSRKRSYEESSREQSVGDEIQDAKAHDPSPDSRNVGDEADENSGDWQLVEGRSRKKSKSTKRELQARKREEKERNKRERRNAQPQNTDTSMPTDSKSNKPAVTCAPAHRLNSSLRISDLQQLVLYCLADGVSPQWLSVRHHNAIRRAVVLMVPGLERGMFTGQVALNDEAAVPDSKAEGDDASGEDAHALVPSAQTENQNNRVADPASLSGSSRNPDSFLPVGLESLDLPGCLHPVAQTFEHLFPIKAPGDDKGNRVHSPVAAILTAPLPKSAEEKRTKGPKPPRLANDWKDTPTPITGFLASFEDLLTSDYVLHPVSCATDVDRETNEQRQKLSKATLEDGWKDAKIDGTETLPQYDLEKNALHANRRILAIDCEMVKAQGPTPESDPEYTLARISIRDWNKNTILDKLVKPSRPVVDYLTAYSGMTAAKLANVTTTLDDIQRELLELFTPDTILVGHSLDSDIRAFKVTHPYIVDTGIIFPHPRGLPMKNALKFLAQKYLGREIQRHTGMGHDSIEDADACLDLVKEKCKHGARWGTPDQNGESIFKRLGRTRKPGLSLPGDAVPDPRDCRTGAVVDHGRPERTIGAAAKVSIPCNTDDEIVAGIKRCVNGDADGSLIPGGGVDFTFARMRELEARRGWASDSAPNLVGPGGNNTELTTAELTKSVSNLVKRIKDIHDGLPKCTLFVVYSGVGDPREMKRLMDMQKQFRKEYSIKKWDEISVKWTDTEEQALRKAVQKARDGVGFVTVT